MCGIFGVKGTIVRERLSSSLASLSHRGPDDHGIFIDNEEQVAFAHTRLSIIDTSSNGKQPMVSESGRYIISYNGEIYNFDVLREYLISQGFKFKSKTDTEVLLNLYEFMGLEMFNKLDGIFAFAIFDKKDKKIVLARDKFGIKPLYFYSSRNNFIFSSETEAITNYLGKKPTLNKNSYLMSLKYLWNPLKESFIDEIKKVDPGSFIVIGSSELEEKKYSNLPLLLNSKKEKIYSEKESTKKLVFETLKQTVEDQMISDVPLGAFLSGGLDSSSIAYFASQKNPDLECFTIETPDANADGFVNDLPYARKVAKFLNLKLNVCSFTVDDLIRDIEETIKIMNEPISDPAIFNTYLICKEAKKNNIKVLLSGTGGDDIFTGYRRHRALMLRKFLGENLNFKNIRFLDPLLNENFPFLRRTKKLIRSFDPNSNSITNYFSWINKDIFDLIVKEPFKKIINEDPLEDFLNKNSGSKDLSEIEKMLCLEQRFFLAEHNLHYTDKMSMAAGIEVRVPFLGNDISELASNVNENLLTNLISSKKILKDAMKGFLPKEITHRPKTGFGAPIRKWVKSDLRNYIREKITKNNIQNTNILEYEGVMKLIKLNEEGKIDASYTIMQILSLIVWNEISRRNL